MVYCIGRVFVTSAVKKTTLWPQWVTSAAATLSVLSTGMMLGWTSPYLARLTSEDSGMSLHVTDSQASWIASLFNLGRILGAILGAIIQDLIGRKWLLLVSGIPLAAGWMSTIAVNSVPWLYTARFSSGTAYGMIWSALPIFLGEIADPSIRGALVSITINGAAFGRLLGTIIGPYVSMTVFAYISLVPNVLFVILFAFIPESPHHYIRQNEIELAEKSLRWFRREIDVKKEIRSVQDVVNGSQGSVRDMFREFWLPCNRRACIIILCLNFWAQFSGINSIMYYAEIILTKNEIGLTASTVVIASGLLGLISGCTASVFFDRFGRKHLLVSSSLGVSLSLAMLGVHFHLLSLGLDSHHLTWLPILSMFAMNIFVSFGLYLVPSAILSEIFPTNVKTLAGCMSALSSASFAFASAKTYQPLVKTLGDTYLCWTYSAIVCLAVPFTYFVIPETNGKTLQDIQTLYEKRTSQMDNFR